MTVFTNGAVPWNSLDNNTRLPTTSELETGYPCGEADRELFNFTAAYAWGQVHNVLLNSGVTPDLADLSQLPKAVQSGAMNYAVAGGTANALTITLTPAVSSFPNGFAVRVRTVHTNTGVSTLNGDPIVRPSGENLRAGDIPVIADLIKIDYGWVLTNPASEISGALVVATSSVVLTKPYWANRAYVRMCGGGGGGGGCQGTNPLYDTVSGGGGGAGEYREGVVSVTTSTVSVTIGGGGGAGMGPNIGGNGGATSFGSLMGANGGQGGQKTTNTSTPGGEGGRGGFGGALAFAGGYGSDGQCSGHIIGGNGAPSFFGGAARAGQGQPGGGFGTTYGFGSGGGGAYDATGAGGIYNGGNGGGGICIVQWLP